MPDQPSSPEVEAARDKLVHQIGLHGSALVHVGRHADDLIDALVEAVRAATEAALAATAPEEVGEAVWTVMSATLAADKRWREVGLNDETQGLARQRERAVERLLALFAAQSRQADELRRPH